MKVITTNKKAYHNYFISDNFEAGVMLEGSEVKSVRDGGISINEAFIIIKDGEVFLKNAYIKQYDKTSSFAPNEKRTRKLLLNKAEILKLKKKCDVSGNTLIPLKVYINNGIVKIECGLAKGKKLYDKRESLKQKSAEMEIKRYSKKI